MYYSDVDSPVQINLRGSKFINKLFFINLKLYFYNKT